MGQVVVQIAGRTYRMNCGEGEEPHIENLARQVEAKIEELRGAFGEIGEQRIVVMAALTMADELFAARERIAVLEAQTEENDTLVERLTQGLEAAAARVEQTTAALNGQRPAD